MSLRDKYDDWHTKYHNLNSSYDDTSTPWYAWVRDSIGDVVGLKTLEVACGRGGFVRTLASAGACAYGIDFSMAALHIGQERAISAESAARALYTQGDAHALPFPDNCFDICVSCETIEHLPDPLRAVREFHRVTREGGRLFLTTPNYLNFMGLYELYAKFRHPGQVPDQPLDRIQMFFQIRRLLERAGWTILSSDGTVHQFPFIRGRNPIRIQSLEANLRLRKLLSIFALTYCLVAQKRGGYAAY